MSFCPSYGFWSIVLQTWEGKKTVLNSSDASYRNKISLATYAVRHDVIAGRGDESSDGQMAVGGGGGGPGHRTSVSSPQFGTCKCEFYFGLLSPGSFVASACLSFVSQIFFGREEKLPAPVSAFHRISSFLQWH